jgi:hypothetical protein
LNTLLLTDEEIRGLLSMGEVLEAVEMASPRVHNAASPNNRLVIQLQGLNDADDLVGASIFPACSASNFVACQAIFIDGGITAA